MASAYPEMGPGRGATRASVLAMNPSNAEASAMRREKLLMAFDDLDCDTRADLLEFVETITSQGQHANDYYVREVRDIIRKVWAQAGWGDTT